MIIASGRNVFDIHMGDASAHRASFYLFNKVGDFFAVSFNDDLDSPVGEVAGIARQSENSAHIASKIAKAHPLHPALDNDAFRTQPRWNLLSYLQYTASKSSESYGGVLTTAAPHADGQEQQECDYKDAGGLE